MQSISRLPRFSILGGALLALVAISSVAPNPGHAAPAHGHAKPAHAATYYFQFAETKAAAEVAADAAAEATPRITAQVTKALSSTPGLVANVDGAPDWQSDGPGFSKFLTAHHIDNGYRVAVEITEASLEVEQVEDRPNTQLLVVKVALRMLGETLPKRTIAFTGEGRATIKQDVGKKISTRDREFAWDGAAELAVADAIKSSMAKLSLPLPPKK